MAKKKIRKFSKTNRRRLLIVFLFVLVCFVCLIIRLVQINIADGDTYEKNVLTLLNYDGQTIPYKRGDITDRNGTVLATSEKIYNLVLDPYVITQSTDEKASEYVAEVLEEYFSIDQATVKKTLEEQPNSRYVVLRRKMTYDEKKPYDDFLSSEDENDQKIISAVSSGIWFEESYQRMYPFSTLACDLIGFTSGDDIGLWGIESYYDKMLSGTDGRKYGYLNDDVDLQKVTEEPHNGKTIVSTVDINIQRIAEKYISEFMQETGAKNVAALVMNPNNGEVLGMANAPVFDLNKPRDLTIAGYTEDQIANMNDQDMSDALYQVWRNFCVNDTYEPGSTVKTMTVSYALDQALVDPDENFVCDGGQTYTDGTFVSCNSVHENLTLTGSIVHSCNDVMMQLSDRIGAASFIQMQKLFGFGQLTGIDLPGEASCAATIYTADTMGPVELWTSSFGQGYNTTMVQVASAFSSIVNGGYYYKPHVVSEIASDSGNTIQVIDKTLMRTTVSNTTSEWMKNALYQTVESGSGQPAQVAGYRIGGKTGTAEKVPRGTKARLVSFIGAAPIDDPQLVVYVVVDEANAEDQGQSSFASTIAGKIFSEALPYLQIFPTEEVSETETDENYDDYSADNEDEVDANEGADEGDNMDEADNGDDGSDDGQAVDDGE
ncbi:MAG: penicillin-binding protein 2 [Coprococcus sp.]|uniref:peptidoglycan D,D-transpeptidase FtsI family protein n=1 Tax=Coprococcus catus TaxID=116085 RepID=UPI001C02FA78|nr:penicillin-binding protein 2 [Coprococcus catus]MBT9774219.1 peptidoglycan glycosyltransferase [Coprococcus catus]